tara:strand:- start:51 stop:233 length:183 start_codon:yes stop_codon:yes gene_type:complete
MIMDNKKEIKKFNKSLIDEIDNDSLLMDIFGLTMGCGDNFWVIHKDDLEKIIKDALGGFK